jgi:hypothetical protein
MKGSFKKRWLFLPLVLLLFNQTVFSLDGEWVCGITAFSGTLSRENSFLFRHFPLLLYHRISAYETHILSEEELASLEDEERNRARKDLVDKWGSLLEERDRLIFQENPEEYERLTNELNDIKESLDPHEEEKSQSDQPEFQREQPLRIDTPGKGALLFDSPEDALMGASDFVLSGFIGRAGEYLLIEVTGRYRTDEETISLWTGAGKLEDLDRLAREASDTLKTYLLGREWSALSISVQPGNGQIFLNGTSLGTGQMSKETLYPGKAILEVRLPGYKLYSEEIDLKASQRVDREIALIKGDSDLIEIITRPAGADVMLGSSFMGETPLTLNRPAIEESLFLVLDGYDRVISSLGPESKARLEFNLTSGGVDWEEQRLVTKDKLYNSLGFFTLSLAAPIILYSAAENQATLANGYASAYNTAPSQDLSDKYHEAYDNFYLSYGAFWGTLAVSGVLLGVSINRLVKYIKASENSIEQKE